MLREFKEFIMRGNVIDMAVGIIIGAAFGSIVKSLVDDVIMPPIGLLLGKVDFSNLFLVIREGKTAGVYDTVAAAKAAGAVTNPENPWHLSDPRTGSSPVGLCTGGDAQRKPESV